MMQFHAHIRAHIVCSVRCSIATVLAIMLSFVFSGCATRKRTAENKNAYITYPTTRITAHRNGESQILSHSSMRVKRTVEKNVQQDANATAPTTSDIQTTDLWLEIARGIHIRPLTSRRYHRIFKRYADNQAFFDRISRNATGYLHYVVQEVKKRNMPMVLTLLPIVESDYDSHALSHAGAAGAWQIIPSTGRLLDIQQDWWFDGRLDIVSATDGALTYLQSMYDRFGSWKLALAAYNCGPSCVSRAINYNRKRNKPTTFEHLRLPKETKDYVPKLYAIGTIIKDPTRYGIFLPPISNRPFFAVVPLDQQVSFPVIANKLGLDVDTLYALNSGYKHWATHPHRNSHLIVPVTLEQKTRTMLQNHDTQIIWQRYLIQQNQTLAQISKKDNLPLEEILQIHDIQPSKKYTSNKVILAPIQKSHSVVFKQRFEKIIKNLEYRDSKQYYRVRRGDSLWSIAKKHNTSVAKLMRINKMRKKSYIYPGNRIKIYEKRGYQYAQFTPPYTRKSIRISYLDESDF